MENESFNYTYSAAEQQELLKIREKYVPKEESIMEQIRRLDASATKRGSAVSLMLGIFSSLVLGAGMSCCMVWGGRMLIPGILIGILGIIGVSVTYPLYNQITKKQRQKIAPEILRLTDALMQ